MSIHIGKLIGVRLKEVGMTKSELARRINKARQNINDILNRKSIDTELLFNISSALDYDFFQHYVFQLLEGDRISEPKGEYGELTTRLADNEKELLLTIKDLENARNEIRLLNTIIDLYKENQRKGD